MAIRPNERSYTLAGADSTAFGNNILPTDSGTTYTMTTSFTPDGVGHLVLITNPIAIDLSGDTLTLYGKGANNNYQIETIAGPMTLDSVQSTLYFSELTSVIINTDNGTNYLDFGITGDSVELQTIAFDWRCPRPRIVIDQGDITGYSVQFTISKIQEVDKANWIWENAIATQPNVYEFANTATTPYACRVMINEYSDGDSITVQYAQAAR